MTNHKNAENGPINPPQSMRANPPAKTRPTMNIIKVIGPEAKARRGKVITRKKAKIYLEALSTADLLIVISKI